MEVLYIKIVGFDEVSKSLLVSFASDKTKTQNPGDYSPVAFQPAQMWPDVLDLEEIKKRIAVSGMHTAESQAIIEKLNDDPVRIENLKSMVGQTFSYNTADLLPTPENTNTNGVIFSYEIL